MSQARSLSVALAAAVLASLSPATASQAAEPSRALWVMSYNIRYDSLDDRPDWRARRGPMVEQIRFFAPDILGLQEALPAMVDDLAGGLAGYARYGVGRDDGAGRGETTTIFYRAERFQRVLAKTYWCSPTPDTPSKAYDAALPRTFTRLVLKDRATGVTFDVRNAHLDHVGVESRAQCAAQILALAPWPGARLITLGDFNSAPGDAPYRLLTAPQAPYRDAREAASSVFSPTTGTFNRFTPASIGPPIDYIFVDRRLNVARFAVPTDVADAGVISDHFPVLAEITLSPSRTSGPPASAGSDR